MSKMRACVCARVASCWWHVYVWEVFELNDKLTCIVFPGEYGIKVFVLKWLLSHPIPSHVMCRRVGPTSRHVISIASRFIYVIFPDFV